MTEERASGGEEMIVTCLLEEISWVLLGNELKMYRWARRLGEYDL